MSHFTVTVCLDGDGMPDLNRTLTVARDMTADAAAELLSGAVSARLDAILAPYSKNLEVEPYRDYKEGSPEDYWFCTVLRDEGKLPAAVTWEDIALTYNERYGSDGERLLTDEAGRAYTMSTYNPRSKWDWFQVGGRWGGKFAYREGHDREVLKSRPHWMDGPDDVVMPLHCDGGPISALNLDKTREEAATARRKELAEWRTVTAGTPGALPWSVFRDNISEGSGYTAEQAREEYHSQPRIAALQGTDFRWADDPVSTYDIPEAQFLEKRRAHAIPGWATVTTDGRWMEKGKMGWWALNDATEGSTIGYLEAANAYIGALPADAWLINVDCHI